MRTTAVARRFARALLEVGRESGVHEQYGKELRTVVAVFAGAPELYKVLLNPMYKVEERSSLVAKVAESIKASEHVSRFLTILVETRKIKLLDEIAAAYSVLEDEASGRLRVVVESPAELDSALIDAVKEKLHASTGKEVLVSTRTNPELLGGLVIRMENTILDGSLRTQLENMKEIILEGVV